LITRPRQESAIVSKSIALSPPPSTPHVARFTPGQSWRSAVQARAVDAALGLLARDVPLEDLPRLTVEATLAGPGLGDPRIRHEVIAISRDAARVLVAAIRRAAKAEGSRRR
jgi:hypothetical protein